MNRRSLREQVFKLLFRVEFIEKEEMEEQCHLFLEHEEIEMSENDETHIIEKYKAIHEKLEEIDSMINEKAKGWSKKFKELCGKAEAEGAVLGAQPAVAGAVAMQPQIGVVPATQPVQPAVAPVQQPMMTAQPVQPAVVPTPTPVAPTPVQPVTVAPIEQPVAPVQQTVQPVMPAQPAVVPVQTPVTPAPAPVQPVPAAVPTPVAPAQVAPAPVVDPNQNNQIQQ